LITIKPFSVDMLEGVYRLCENAIEYHYLGIDCFKHVILNDPDFDAELSLVAFIDNVPVAFICAVERKNKPVKETEADRVAELIIFASDRRFRGRGLVGKLYENVETVLRGRGVKEIWVRSTPFFSGLDLRYKRAAVFLMRRLFTPRKVIYDQILNTTDIDLSTEQEEAKFKEQGVIFKKLDWEDMPALKNMLAKHFPGWANFVQEQGSTFQKGFSVHAAMCNGEIVAFAGRDRNNFGPLGTIESHRRHGYASVLVKRVARDVYADGHEEMIIRNANFMYYARAFATPIAPVWIMAKDLTLDPAIKKAKDVKRRVSS
jgi:GNAT superfamily N-acetyltransferase